MSKLSFIVALIIALQVVSCIAEHHIILDKFMDGPKKELFKVYHQIFNKNYNLDTEIGLQKYKVFKDNLKFIKDENSKGHEYQLGLNQFSDLTNDEYRKTLNLNIDEWKNSFLTGQKFTAVEELEAGEVVVDYSQYFGAIKDQGGCGSCWSFGAMGAVEGNYAKKFDIKIRLAEQQLVDCDNNNSACDGGWPTYAFDFLIKNGAIAESNYPYTSGTTGVQSKCKQTKSTPVYKVVSDQKYCMECSYSEWQGLIKEGPVNIAVDAGGREFQSYKSGILNIKSCGQANHAVIAIALQNDSTGDFLTIRNSWGASWGDKGHIKLRYNASTDTCQGTSYAWLPIVSKGADPGPSPSPVPPQPTPDPTNDCPSLWKKCDFKGESVNICESKPDLSGIGWGNAAQAFKIGSATKVEFFKKKGCIGNNGDDLTLKQDAVCFNKMDDPLFSTYLKKAQSLAVSKCNPPAGCIWVFQEACYLGGKQEICQDLKNLELINFNDQISSVRLGTGVSATFYIDPEFSGTAFGITKDWAGFDSTAKILNDSVSSIRIHSNN
jgi:C1A family cysteine protease